MTDTVVRLLLDELPVGDRADIVMRDGRVVRGRVMHRPDAARIYVIDEAREFSEALAVADIKTIRRAAAAR